MKINDSLKASGLGAINPEKAKTNANPVVSGSDNDSDDKVTLSGQSAELKKIATSADAEPFDVQKVEDIKKAILNGEFKVDTGKVADGLINSVKDLLSSQKA